MGFNRRYLPEIDQLKELRNKFDNDRDFVKHVIGKSDAILGSSESMGFMEEIHKRIQAQSTNITHEPTTPGGVS